MYKNCYVVTVCNKNSILTLSNFNRKLQKEKTKPAWVVGEQRQLFFDILPCLANPPVVTFSDVGDMFSDSVDESISTFISLVVIAPKIG